MQDYQEDVSLEHARLNDVFALLWSNTLVNIILFDSLNQNFYEVKWLTNNEDYPIFHVFCLES